MTRHNDVMLDPLIKQHAPLIREAYAHVAHSTVRNRGTLGGNLAHADPASELPAVMLALDARIIVRNMSASRVLSAEEFFLGTYTTALAADEILTEILVSKRSANEGSAFEEVSLRQGDFAISAVAARLTLRGGVCQHAAIALAGVSDVQVRAKNAEAVLVGKSLTESLMGSAADAAVDKIEFLETATVTSRYRRDVTRELVRRALSRASSGKTAS